MSSHSHVKTLAKHIGVRHHLPVAEAVELKDTGSVLFIASKRSTGINTGRVVSTLFQSTLTERNASSWDWHSCYVPYRHYEVFAAARWTIMTGALQCKKFVILGMTGIVHTASSWLVRLYQTTLFWHRSAVFILLPLSLYSNHNFVCSDCQGNFMNEKCFNQRLFFSVVDPPRTWYFQNERAM